MSERHTVAHIVEFPDDTSTWQCSCGERGVPMSRFMEAMSSPGDDSFVRHRRSAERAVSEHMGDDQP